MDDFLKETKLVFKSQLLAQLIVLFFLFIDLRGRKGERETLLCCSMHSLVVP